MSVFRHLSQSALAWSALYLCGAAASLCLLLGHWQVVPVTALGWLFAGLLLVGTPLVLLCSTQHQQLRLTQQELLKQSDLDLLTGLLNRPAFHERCTQQLKQDNHNTSNTLLLIDIDHFSEFSEAYGDACADRALQHIAAHLVARVRSNDLFARMDGERFALLLRGTNHTQAERLASRMVSAIAQRPFSSQGSIVEFTASCGFADSANASDLEELFTHAKSALLGAKRSGHNKAVAYDGLRPAEVVTNDPELARE